MKEKFWLARNRSGQYKIFDSKPVWNEKIGLWVGEMTGVVQMFLLEMEGRGLALPEMKPGDEPIEITVSVEGEGVCKRL